jgi:hypothetical protein
MKLQLHTNETEPSSYSRKTIYFLIPLAFTHARSTALIRLHSLPETKESTLITYIHNTFIHTRARARLLIYLNPSDSLQLLTIDHWLHHYYVGHSLVSGVYPYFIFATFREFFCSRHYTDRCLLFKFILLFILKQCLLLMLRPVLSLTARTLVLRIRITLEACISAFFCVVLSCVGRGLASGWSTVQGVLPNIHRFIKSEKLNSGSEKTMGSNPWRRWWWFSYFYNNNPNVWNRNSSVGIALGHGLDDQGSRVRFPVGVGNFSLHHRVHNGSGAHPASYPMGARGLFPWG